MVSEPRLAAQPGDKHGWRWVRHVRPCVRFGACTLMHGACKHMHSMSNTCDVCTAADARFLHMTLTVRMRQHWKRLQRVMATRNTTPSYCTWIAHLPHRRSLRCWYKRLHRPGLRCLMQKAQQLYARCVRRARPACGRTAVVQRMCLVLLPCCHAAARWRHLLLLV